MSNESGHATTLVASHPANRHAERTGVFARRNLAEDPEVIELADAIMSAQWCDEMDVVGATEIARLLTLIDRIDNDLAARGLVNKRGAVRALVDHRRRFSSQLERWLSSYGMTPASRAELMRDVATGSLAADIARRRATREGRES